MAEVWGVAAAAVVGAGSYSLRRFAKPGVGFQRGQHTNGYATNPVC